MARAETSTAASTAGEASNVSSHSPRAERTSNGEPSFAGIDGSRIRARRIGLLLIILSCLFVITVFAGLSLAIWYLR